MHWTLKILLPMIAGASLVILYQMSLLWYVLLVVVGMPIGAYLGGLLLFWDYPWDKN